MYIGGEREREKDFEGKELKERERIHIWNEDIYFWVGAGVGSAARESI